MEPYLEELKNKILKEYQYKNVLVYPVNNNEIAFFQVTNKKCRIHLFKPGTRTITKWIWNQTTGFYEHKEIEVSAYLYYCYGFNGKLISRIIQHDVDEQDCEILNDNDISKHLKKFCFIGFRNFKNYSFTSRFDITDFLKEYFYDIVEDKNKFKLFCNLFDLDLIRTSIDFEEIIKLTVNSSSIKEVFGISAKYLKIVGICCFKDAIIFRDLGFSPEETEFLWSNVPRTYYNCSYKNVLKFCVSNRNINFEKYFSYLDYISRLNVNGIKHSFPKCPKDYSNERLNILYNKVVPIVVRQQYLSSIDSEIRQSYIDNILPLAKQFEYKGKEYFIVACPSLEELGVEGNILNTCLSGYVSSVADGKEYIYFLRRKDKPYDSFYTIDVLPNKTVRQIHGEHNCNLPKELYPFVKRWAKKYDLKLGYIDGRLCHV